jgi:hypothetical protein
MTRLSDPTSVSRTGMSSTPGERWRCRKSPMTVVLDRGSEAQVVRAPSNRSRLSATSASTPGALRRARVSLKRAGPAAWPAVRQHAGVGAEHDRWRRRCPPVRQCWRGLARHRADFPPSIPPTEYSLSTTTRCWLLCISSAIATGLFQVATPIRSRSLRAATSLTWLVFEGRTVLRADLVPRAGSAFISRRRVAEWTSRSPERPVRPSIANRPPRPGARVVADDRQRQA